MEAAQNTQSNPGLKRRTRGSTGGHRWHGDTAEEAKSRGSGELAGAQDK